MSSETTEQTDDARLRVVFAGGHGQIALLAQRRLAAEGHQPVGLIRKPEYADDLRAVGSEPVVFDLENQTAAELAELVRGADDFVVGSTEVFQIYLRAKAEADEIIRSRDLDWTIVRPGGLSDDPASGHVLIAERTGRGQIPRDDVAAVVTRLVVDGTGRRTQFELISGETPIAEALASL